MFITHFNTMKVMIAINEITITEKLTRKQNIKYMKKITITAIEVSSYIKKYYLKIVLST